MTPAKLKATRNSLEWTLSDMARYTGYSRQYLHHVEKGKFAVSAELVEKLTNAVSASIQRYEKILQKLQK